MRHGGAVPPITPLVEMHERAGLFAATYMVAYLRFGVPAIIAGLAVHHDRDASVVVLEYAVHGRAARTGHAYDNRFVSVITINDRKVTHWRDYLDPVAVFDATGWPAQHT